MKKLFAHIVAIAMFLGSVASAAALLFSDLASDWPVTGKWAVWAGLIGTLISTWLPRIQKIGQTLKEIGDGER